MSDDTDDVYHICVRQIIITFSVEMLLCIVVVLLLNDSYTLGDKYKK